MGNLLFVAEHIGNTKAVPFTRKVYENHQHLEINPTTFFHSMRKTPNEPNPSENLFMSNSGRKLNPRAIPELQSSISRWDIDVVYAHSIRPILASIIIKILYNRDLRVFARLSSQLYRDNRWLDPTLRRINSAIDKFIAPSKLSKEKFVEVGINPEKVHIHYNFLDLDKFDPNKYDPSEERDCLGIDGDPVIAYVGRLIGLKNIDALIRAFNGLLETYPNGELLLVGEGEKKMTLEYLARRLGCRDSVRFLGFRDDIPGIISASDAGVLISDYESFGMPIIEFLVMNRPIIATDVGIVQEVEGVERIDEPEAELIRKGLIEIIEKQDFATDRDDFHLFTGEAYFERLEQLCEEPSK